MVDVEAKGKSQEPRTSRKLLPVEGNNECGENCDHTVDTYISEELFFLVTTERATRTVD
jgi:hypothetical protein